MVKVAENSVVDLDLFPGNQKSEELANQTRDAVAGKLPPEQAQGIAQNAQNAAMAVGGTVGGGVKGVVDTLGSTVGTLGSGLQGTVQGVGDGVGSTVQYAGGMVGSGAGQVAGMVTGSGSKEGDTKESHDGRNIIDQGKQELAKEDDEVEKAGPDEEQDSVRAAVENSTGTKGGLGADAEEEES